MSTKDVGTLVHWILPDAFLKGLVISEVLQDSWFQTSRKETRSRNWIMHCIFRDENITSWKCLETICHWREMPHDKCVYLL